MFISAQSTSNFCFRYASHIFHGSVTYQGKKYNLIERANRQKSLKYSFRFMNCIYRRPPLIRLVRENSMIEHQTRSISRIKCLKKVNYNRARGWTTLRDGQGVVYSLLCQVQDVRCSKSWVIKGHRLMIIWVNHFSNSRKFQLSGLKDHRLKNYA